MLPIISQVDFEPVRLAVRNAFLPEPCLPDMVFAEELRHGYGFLTFDDLRMPRFFRCLQKFAVTLGGGDGIALTSIKPDPENYFANHFSFFGSIVFERSDGDQEFLDSINNFPVDSPADALNHNTDSLAFVSLSGEWAIYGERDFDLAVCGFSSAAVKNVFDLVCGTETLGGVTAAADFAYGRADSAVQNSRLIACYS